MVSITVIVMPRLVFRQVAARLKLAAQQAKQHSDSAAALRRRQEELEQKSAQVASHMVQVSNLSYLLIPPLRAWQLASWQSFGFTGNLFTTAS